MKRSRRVLTVVFEVRRWRKDVQVIVQTSLVEARLVRLRLFPPIQAGAVVGKIKSVI